MKENLSRFVGGMIRSTWRRRRLERGIILRRMLNATGTIRICQLYNQRRFGIAMWAMPEC